MAITSQAPEGFRHRCPICEKGFVSQSVSPEDAGCCPKCGDLLRQLREYLNRSTGLSPPQITLASRFREDMGMDSLDLVELMMELEEEFGVAIPDAEAEQMKTVADFLRCVERQLRGT